ncbi:metallophosphoesterase [Domibacillus sp. PGB-M46]|uniref:metallophosphoesterase n=1 Tax=Domibacillus sp. PGB-M46 TaxID=2910255 RepID=UPI001F55E220|nr:metallophosphoesterase [Domibacillus sp. PGB-M46]MCI2257078.1 metallophosphoesterase [Domibacillus sp. PGB-M46]
MKKQFLGKMKVCGFALIATGYVASCFSPTVQALEHSGKDRDEKAPDLVFPVISDVHIKDNGTDDLEKFQNAFNQLNEQAPKQDSFAIVGDLTESGTLEQYDRFLSIYNGNKQSEAVSLSAIGNHDYWNGLSFNDAQKRFLAQTGMESIYSHKVIKGYHFIILAPEDDLTEGYYSKQQITWLGEQLKKAAEDEPQKPIFVLMHHPMKNTVFGSEWGTEANGQLMYDTLKKYPQVIHFSGHTHYPLDDPRTIDQKDFTTVGTSSVNYMWTEAGYLQGELPPGNEKISQGLIVEAHKNKVVIKRRDFHNNDWTGEPWVIKLPIKNNKFDYTNSRDQIKPSFNQKDTITLIEEKSTAGSLEIKFDQAHDNLLLHSYKVVATEKETGKTVSEFKAFSDYYVDPVPKTMTLPVQGLKPDTTYVIKVTAIDAFGNESKNFLTVEGKTTSE